MSDKLDVRRYQLGEEKEIVPLLISVFPEWQKRQNPMAYWKWKYIDTPYGTDIRVIEKDGNIIFVGHQMLESIKIADSTILATYGDDFATHIEHQGKGLWSSTRPYADEMIKRLGIKFSFSLSSNPIVIETNKRRGNIGFPKEIAHMTKIRDISLHLKAKGIKNPSLMKIGYKIKKTVDQISISSPVTESHESLPINEVKRFDIQHDLFWDSIKFDYDFIIDKSSKFLNWRFCDPRGGEYRILDVRKDDVVQGVIVTGIKTENDYTEGYVMELLTLAGKDYVADILLKAALDQFENENVNAAHYKECVEGRYQHVLKRHGFIEMPGMHEIYIPCSFKGEYHLEPIFRNAPSTRLHFGYADYY